MRFYIVLEKCHVLTDARRTKDFDRFHKNIKNRECLKNVMQNLKNAIKEIQQKY